jgi:MFS family permease
MFTAIFTCTYSLSYTLPTMINLLGYSAATAQLLTIPVYAFACLLCVITSVLSDRNHHRATFFFVPMGLIVVGLIIGLATDPERLPGVVYFAMFLIGGGTFSGGPSTMSWMSNNLAGQWKRAVSMALLATIANLVGGTIGSNIFLAREKPKYTTAYSVLLAFITCAVLSGWALVFMIRRWNAQRTVLIEQAQQEGRDLDAECKDLGDKNPHFKYTL